MVNFTYQSNNSGGSWWLSDDDWRNLEKAGWRVQWGGDNDDYTGRLCETAEQAEEYRRLGALAKKATGDFDSEEEAIESFEKATGQTYTDEGCSCCGEPHYIYITR